VCVCSDDHRSVSDNIDAADDDDGEVYKDTGDADDEAAIYEDLFSVNQEFYTDDAADDYRYMPYERKFMCVCFIQLAARVTIL